METLYTENLPEKIITGIRLKLEIKNSDDKKELDNYFNEYAKIVTFAAKRITAYRSLYERLPSKREGDAWINEKGLCTLCNNETDLRWKDVKSGNKICNSCYYRNLGKRMIRKKFVPTSKRKVENDFNVKNVGNISKTHYHLALKDAAELIDALEKQRKEKIRGLMFDKKRQKRFREILEDSSKRIELPLQKGQRIIRYVHIEDKDKNLRGWSLRKLQSYVKDLDKKIEHRRKSLINNNPESKGSKISLHNNTVFDIKENKVRITLWEKKWYKFSGSNIVNKKGKEYVIGKLSKIRPNKYGMLIRKLLKDGDYDYFLQYPIEESIQKRNLDNIMGIDIGLNKLAAFSIFQINDGSKPLIVKIYRNQIMSMKISHRKHLYFLKGVHNKNRKIRNIRPISRRIDLYLHEISSEIVKKADEFNAKISMELLKDMKIKSKASQSAKQKYSLSLFEYKKLRSLIEYKAHRLGIPTILVDPEGTSYTCSKCGSTNTTRPKQAIFRCNDCSVELNADYNASVNIARKALSNRIGN